MTSATVVSLPPRPTPDQAYEVYAGLGNRSYRLTAELTRVPEGTLRRWAVEGRWADRADREAQKLRAKMDIHTRAVLAAGMPERLTDLAQLCKSPDEQVRLRAIRTWVEWFGVPPAEHGQAEHDEDGEAPDYDAMSVAELAAVVRERRERR